MNETNDLVAKKVERAQEQGLISIICVGDSTEDRAEGRVHLSIKEQLDAIKPSIKDWSKIVIAYEPLWTLVNNKNAPSDTVQEMHDLIRKWISTNATDAIAQQTRIIYGGIVTETNAESFIV